MEYLTSECAAGSVGPANDLLGTFIATMIALHCNISDSTIWPPDYGRKALRDGLEDYDFVVIGAGSAGSVVAGRLAENPDNQVLLIEAGGDPLADTQIIALSTAHYNTNFDWNYPLKSDNGSCLGQKTGICFWNMGKALGGSHAASGAVYTRGNGRDFDDWKAQGNPEWGWEDVEQYFKKTENFQGNNMYGELGTRGPLNIESFSGSNIDDRVLIRAADELGYPMVDDFFVGKYLGFGRILGTLRDGRRVTTAQAFLTNNRPNLQIIKNAVAKRIIFDKSRRAVRVSFVYKDKYELEVKAKKEIILSAGAVESPKLLMLSGIGPRTHLKSLGIHVLKDLPVGNNLEDHPFVPIFLRLRTKTNRDIKVEMLDAFYDQWVHQKGSYGKLVSDLTGFITTKDDSNYPDIQYRFHSVLNISDFFKTYKDPILPSLEKQIRHSDRMIVVLVYPTRPKSRAVIRLQSKDYQDKPVIMANYFQHKGDVRVLTDGFLKLYEFANTETLKRFDGQFLRAELPECDTYEFHSSKYWHCYIRYMSDSLSHLSSSVKMGPRENKDTVVDSELRVHGVDRLRVIDASIMPNIVSTNTNAAAIMIGEKGADLIRRKWGV